jgi:hypothetical protein
MVALSEPSAIGCLIRVAILTILADDQSHTQKRSRYGIPGNGSVKTIHHTIQSTCLKFVPDKTNLSTFRMDHQFLMILNKDIEEGKTQSKPAGTGGQDIMEGKKQWVAKPAGTGGHQWHRQNTN